MAAQVGVVLSGCGFLDGTEIHEAVLALYFLDRAGFEVRCYAPDREQFHVVDHRTAEPVQEQRNVLAESARIARGDISPLAQASARDLDALVLPGGYGAAKNLSDFALKGAECSVDPVLARLLVAMIAAKKPVVAICIAPAVVAAALRSAGSHAVKLTIGNDPATAEAIRVLGGHHQDCPVDRAIVDEEHRVVTTPAYMLGRGPAEVGAGIEAAIAQLSVWLGLPVATHASRPS